MKKIISCLIKYPSLIVLCTLFINVFCFKTQLPDSGWLNWTWFILICIVCLLNFVFISGVIFNNDDRDNSPQLLSTLASFLIYGSVLLKSIYSGTTDAEIVGFSTLAYFLINGIGQYTCSYMYLFIGSYIYCQYVQLDNWLVVTLFIIGLLSMIASIISIWIDKLSDDDENYDFTIVGIGGILTLAISFILKGNYPVIDEHIVIIFAVYLIVSVYSIFNNKAIFFPLMIVSIVSFVCYFVFPHSYISIALIIFLCFIGISLYSYINMLKTIVNYLFTQNSSLSKKYNDLVDNYNDLADNYKKLMDASQYIIDSYNSPRNNSNIDFTKIFQNEALKVLSRSIIDTITSF